MKFIGMPFYLIALLAIFDGSTSAIAAEPAAPNGNKQSVAQPSPTTPWLGFEVSRADDAVRAQLPKLPKGVGFIISQIDPKGPAYQAGLRELDILWKWNDQWLVNEAQLSTLLDLQKVGDRVTLVVYRAGKEHAYPVTLGESPAQPSTFISRKSATIRRITAAAADPSMPQDVSSRTARLEDAHAVLEMEKRDDGFWLSIIDTQGVPIFDGPYSSSAKADIPLIWQDRVDALQRTLQKTKSQIKILVPAHTSPAHTSPAIRLPQADPLANP